MTSLPAPDPEVDHPPHVINRKYIAQVTVALKIVKIGQSFSYKLAGSGNAWSAVVRTKATAFTVRLR